MRQVIETTLLEIPRLNRHESQPWRPIGPKVEILRRWIEYPVVSMGDLERQLGELVDRHQDRIMDYQVLLLDKITVLLKDKKLSVGVKGNLGRILGTISGGFKSESSSGLTSTDRVELAKNLIQNGQAMTAMLQGDVGFVTRVRLLEKEITGLSDEIGELERQSAKARSERNEPKARELDERSKRLKVKKK